jgi:3-deoxy-D-manno-octulosonic-acid transferase
MEVARKTFAGRTVFNSPLDFGWVVRRDCRHLRPSCLVLVELELWPNLLLAAKRAGIPVVVINCRITERSFRGYRLLHTFVPGFIPSLGVGAFCPQNEVYAERLRGLGIPPERVRVTGSMKYDGLRAKVDPSRREALRRQFGFREDDLVLVGASTHDDEEAQMAGVFPAIVKEFPAARLVLVPRHVERAEAACKAASQAGLRPVRKTQLSEREAPAKDWRTVVVVDTMGELIDVMSLAAVVFVGKSISAENRGGHNVLEPAALGRPVVFGPFMANFQSEAEFLLANGAARQVRGKNGLRDVCLDLLRSPAMREEMGRKGAALVAQNQGATRRNVEVIRGMMGE